MTNKNSEKHPIANNAVITDFFRRALKIIGIMMLITIGLVYYFTQEQKKTAIEKEQLEIKKNESLKNSQLLNDSIKQPSPRNG